MAADFEFDLQGLDSVLAKLQGLSNTIKRKAGSSALRKAGNVIVKAARVKVSAHDDPGTGRKIAKNITLVWNNRVYKATGDLAYQIGVRKGAVLPKKGETPDTGAGGRTPHWRLLELGTEKMQAFPFLRPAMTENAQQVSDVFIQELEKAIDKALA